MNANAQQWLVILLPLLSPLATLAIVMVGFLYNNSRLNDLGDLLRAEMQKNHSEILSRFAELDSRVGRLEQR